MYSKRSPIEQADIFDYLFEFLLEDQLMEGIFCLRGCNSNLKKLVDQKLKRVYTQLVKVSDQKYVFIDPKSLIVTTVKAAKSQYRLSYVLTKVYTKDVSDLSLQKINNNYTTNLYIFSCGFFNGVKENLLSQRYTKHNISNIRDLITLSLAPHEPTEYIGNYTMFLAHALLPLLSRCQNLILVFGPNSYIFRPLDQWVKIVALNLYVIADSNDNNFLYVWLKNGEVGWKRWLTGQKYGTFWPVFANI